MVEGGWFPTGVRMTVLADCSFRAGMDILALMAARASDRGLIEFKGSGMAFGACQVGVRTTQGKDLAVIKSG